jgi:hypothetical protein
VSRQKGRPLGLLKEYVWVQVLLTLTVHSARTTSNLTPHVLPVLTSSFPPTLLNFITSKQLDYYQDICVALQKCDIFQRISMMELRISPLGPSIPSRHASDNHLPTP